MFNRLLFIFVFFALMAQAAEFPGDIRRDTVAANQNGNPSFQYWVLGDPVPQGQAFGMCQGTLVLRQKGLCAFATAAHCLGTKKGESGTYEMYTADFGAVSTVGLIPRRYLQTIDTSSNTDDVALVYFRSPSCTSNSSVQVLSLASYPPAEGTKVWIASRWIPGIHAASVEKTNIVRSDDAGNWQEARDVVQVLVTSSTFPGVRQGDSGGGLFVRDAATNELKLAGVLSTSESGVTYSPKATFSAGTSSEWLATKIAAVAKNNGIDVPPASSASLRFAGEKAQPVTTLPSGTGIRFKERIRILPNTSETKYEIDDITCLIRHPAESSERFVSEGDRFEMLSVTERGEARKGQSSLRESVSRSPDDDKLGPGVRIVDRWASFTLQGLGTKNSVRFEMSCGLWTDGQGVIPTINSLEKVFELRLSSQP